MSQSRAKGVSGKMTADERARFVVALDHDARQPQHSIEMGLRSLHMIAADLRTHHLDKETVDALLRRMSVEVSSVQAAVRQVVDSQRDLIDAIRLDFEDTKPVMRAVDAGDLIERVRKSNMALAQYVDIRGVFSQLTFICDERWIERILNNLIANAVWHSGGTKVVVGARRRDSDIVFEVRDNGRGMVSDEVARVFEPIKAPRLSPIGVQATRSGLGLYNVRVFAERLEGSVHCSSKPGCGTTFSVRLPGPVIRANKARAITHGMSRLTRNAFAAILDPDVSALRATERVLEGLGIDVYADHDPLRWLSVVTDLRRAPDLILLDFQLGGQDCSLQLDIVRRKWGDENPKIIVVTANANRPELARLSLRAPILGKPIVDTRVEFILDVLNGRRKLPEAGHCEP